MNATTSPIGIIGAGIGGLSAAIRLAAAGHRVQIFEQSSAVGGKMNQFVDRGFRWDTGPSVITMRHVLEELFAVANARLEEYVNLRPIHPLTRYFFADGSQLDLDGEWSRLAPQIERFHPQDVAGYLSFLAHAAELHRITGPVFIYDQPPTLASLQRVSIGEMPKVVPWLTLHQLIARHVRSPQMRQLLGRFATYVGADPYQAPSTLGVIAHVELTGGVWYPDGGIYELAAGMARLARELGVEIYTDTPVTGIRLENQRVSGIRLGNGEEISLAAVVANVDVVTVYQKLLTDHVSFRRRLNALRQKETSCSGFALLLGIEGHHENLCHHNIFFSGNYELEFRQIFKEQRPPDEPTIYVAITSKTNPDHAPPGHENWFVLVNAPALSPHFDWQSQTESYTEVVMNTLAAHGYEIRDKIRAIHFQTPLDIQNRTGAWRGALYGISSNRAMNAFQRPHNRAADVHGLYFAGGTTHPGGGVPMVTLSGKVAAQMLMDDLARAGLGRG